MSSENCGKLNLLSDARADTIISSVLFSVLIEMVLMPFFSLTHMYIRMKEWFELEGISETV